MFIYSHNEASEGAKELAKALGAKRIKHEGSKFVGGPGKIVINWGSRNVPPEVTKSKVINTPTALENNCNKLAFFRLVAGSKDGPRTPRWTTDKAEVRKWIAEKRTVVARKVLAGSSGEGIHFMSYENKDGFVDAPLYTEYVKKKDEYRVHFVNGDIIDYQRKALRAGQNVDKVDWRIRNLDAGFVFVRNNSDGTPVNLPKDVLAQAEKAIRICGLDFGAIDLVYNEKEAQAYVLEVNTAPGLQGETVDSYATAFKKHWGK